MKFKMNQLKYEGSSKGIHIFFEYSIIDDNSLGDIFVRRLISSLFPNGIMMKDHLQNYNDIFVNLFNGRIEKDGFVYFDTMEEVDVVEEWLESMLLLDEIADNNT